MTQPREPSTASTSTAAHPHGGRAAGALDDRATQAADYVEQLVVTIRERTTEPALNAARGAIWGTFAVVLLLIAVILVYAILLRVLVISFAELGIGAWAAHLLLGLVWLGLGILIGRKGTQPDEELEPAT